MGSAWELELMKNILLAINASVLFVCWSVNGQFIAEFHAAEARIAVPFVLTNGCLCQAMQTGVTNGGRAAFSFSAPVTGQYAIVAVVEAPDRDSHVLFVNFDSEPKEAESKWEIPVKRGFATNLVSLAAGGPRYFDLEKGLHQLIIRGGDPNVKLSRVSIAIRPSPPTNLHIVPESH